MIYYWLHIAYVFFGSKYFWSEVDMLSDFSRERKVSLLDCEAFRFMANSKYFYYMDLIRLELLFRSPLYEQTVKKKMFPVIGSQKIIYKKPLKRWSKFRITLVLEGWDDKWVYHKQVFTQGDVVCAIGYTKIAFWRKHKVQSMSDIIFKCGVTQKTKEVSKPVLNLFENDSNFLRGENTF